MSVIINVLSVVMDLGDHGHIFCFVLKFKPWYELWKEVMDSAKLDYVLMSEDPRSERTTSFEGEVKALHNVRAPGSPKATSY